MKIVLSSPPEMVAEYPELTEGPTEVPVGRWLHFWHHGAAPETDEGNHGFVFLDNGEWRHQGKIYTDMVICDDEEEV